MAILAIVLAQASISSILLFFSCWWCVLLFPARIGALLCVVCIFPLFASIACGDLQFGSLIYKSTHANQMNLPCPAWQVLYSRTLPPRQAPATDRTVLRLCWTVYGEHKGGSGRVTSATPSVKSKATAVQVHGTARSLKELNARETGEGALTSPTVPSHKNL